MLSKLETNGGKLIAIVFLLIVVIGAAAIMTISGHPLQEPGRELATGIIGGLVTKLWPYLEKT